MAKKTTKLSADDQTLALIEEVRRQRASISESENPNWKTNCAFPWTEGSSNIISLHVCSDIKQLVSIAAFLMDKETSYMDAATALSVDAPQFTWNGFSVADWMSDIKVRIGKIQIKANKQKLESYESRLDKIISPELKRQMELDEISKLLNN